MRPQTLEHPVRRDVSMLVTDVTAFTPFADTTEPEYVFETLAELHGLVGAVVESLEGEIMDLFGDGTFAMFNAVTEVSDAPARAVKAALAIEHRFRDLRTSWTKRGRRIGGVKIALNAGWTSLGQVKAGSFSRHVAIGSPVYATFHLSRAAREGEILATQRIAQAAHGIADVISRPDVKLSAFARDLQIFQIRPLSGH